MLRQPEADERAFDELVRQIPDREDNQRDEDQEHQHLDRIPMKTPGDRRNDVLVQWPVPDVEAVGDQAHEAHRHAGQHALPRPGDEHCAQQQTAVGQRQQVEGKERVEQRSTVRQLRAELPKATDRDNVHHNRARTTESKASGYPGILRLQPGGLPASLSRCDVSQTTKHSRQEEDRVLRHRQDGAVLEQLRREAFEQPEDDLRCW